MMKDLAKHIIARAQSKQLKLTNLHLHKVMYFTLVNAAQNGSLSKETLGELYDRPFEVWSYGPTIRSLHETYSVFGASPLFFPENESDEYAFLNAVIDPLLTADPFDLVKKSYQHAYWKQNEQAIERGHSAIPYSVEQLLHPE